jgi:hypothetical protein
MQLHFKKKSFFALLLLASAMMWVRPLETVARERLFMPMVWYFPIDKSTIYLDYSDNKKMFGQLDELLHSPQYHGQVADVKILAAASPIASVEYNNRLSIARVIAMRNYIGRTYPEIDPRIVGIKSGGIDWDGFRAIIEAEPNMPYRQQILSLLNSGMSARAMLDELRTIGGIQTQNFLIRSVYPRLQYATVQITMKDGNSTGSPDKSPLRVLIEEVPEDCSKCQEKVVEEKPIVYVTKEPEPADTVGVRLKTNLLYDVGLLLPNLQFEWLPSRRFSMQLEGYFAWWNNHNWYWRIQAVGAEMRFWLGKEHKYHDVVRRNTGWFLAPYGGVFRYDTRIFPKDYTSPGYQSDFSYTVGLALGHTWPIGKRTYLEVELGLGYFSGKYDKYRTSYCDDCYPKIGDGVRHFFGPTKAAINLVWDIGKTHRNDTTR